MDKVKQITYVTCAFMRVSLSLTGLRNKCISSKQEEKNKNTTEILNFIEKRRYNSQFQHLIALRSKTQETLRKFSF